MRVGKTAALALGGGIILLEIAKEKGYIKINWDKVGQNIDKVADKVEEQVTGQGPNFIDKVNILLLLLIRFSFIELFFFWLFFNYFKYF